MDKWAACFFSPQQLKASAQIRFGGGLGELWSEVGARFRRFRRFL